MAEGDGDRLRKYCGGCHCGAIKYEVLAPTELELVECNCSVCLKKQNHHFIVPAKQFTLLQGENELTTYTFNTHRALHRFCRVCGVQSFYRPRSNPDGVGVMPHCLEEHESLRFKSTMAFDGRHWEQSMEQSGSELKRMSEDTAGD